MIFVRPFDSLNSCCKYPSAKKHDHTYIDTNIHELHARTESSNIVDFMVKFIWQLNLPMGFYRRLIFFPFLLAGNKGKRLRHPQAKVVKKYG